MKMVDAGVFKYQKEKKSRRWLGWLVFVGLLALLSFGSVILAQAYVKESNIGLSVSDLSKLKKGSVIDVTFSSAMLKKSVESGFTVTPSLATEIQWANDRQMEIRLADDLRPETQFLVEIKGAKSAWMVSQKDYSFSFSSVQAPALESIYPKDQQSDIDLFDSIKIKFDKPLGEEFMVEIMIDPQTGFDYVLDDSQKELTIVPTEKLQEQTDYKIRIKLNNRKFADFSKILYEGTFQTRKPMEVTYGFDAEGQPTKTEPVKEQVDPKIMEGKYIDIDLSSQTLFIFQDGMEKGAYKVSTGKNGMNTPEGTFKVRLKADRPWSKKYGLYMPWFIGFTALGHGIHELPEWPGGYKEGASHLGTPVSHGCVRLGVGPAKLVYDFISVGDPIIIHQ